MSTIILVLISKTSASESEYQKLVEYADYIVISTYTEETVNFPDWTKLSGIEATTILDIASEEKSVIEVTLSSEDITIQVTYPVKVESNKVNIGIDYKYISTPSEWKRNTIILVVVFITMYSFLCLITFFKQLHKK